MAGSDMQIQNAEEQLKAVEKALEKEKAKNKTLRLNKKYQQHKKAQKEIKDHERQMSKMTQVYHDYQHAAKLMYDIISFEKSRDPNLVKPMKKRAKKELAVMTRDRRGKFCY